MLNIEAKTLSHAIKTVLPAVASRPTHPILGNIYIETNESQLILRAFNLSTGITHVLENASGNTDNQSITLPAKLFDEIVSSLDGNVFIKVLSSELGDGVVNIKSNSTKSELSYLDADEFPSIPVVDEQTIEFDSKVFCDLVESVLYCASTDETKQILTGVHFVSTPSFIEVAATDGHRLTVDRFEYEESKEITETRLTIPSSALSDILKVIKGSDKFDLTFDSTNVSVKVRGTTLVSRILQGQYPPYNQLLPVQFSRTATFNSKAIIKALSFAAIALDGKETMFTLDLNNTDQTAKLSCKGFAQNTANCPCDLTGINDTFSISFNHRYLSEAIKNLKCSEFTLNMNEFNQPVVLTPLNGAKTKALVMPIQNTK